MAISHFCERCGAENGPEDTVCHACQQLLVPPSALEESGTLLNERYAILSEIGAGGFSAVYKARDIRESQRLVAIKQINLKGLSSQEIIEATDTFNREVEILSTLSHPLLPRIFDRFSDPEHWYLVMDFIDGSTLDDYLQQHRTSSPPAVAGLPLGETLVIALQLCDVLRYLHAQQPPVIFRDLKPGNIMRTHTGKLYLIDFGIARRFKPGQIKDTIPFGSPGFAAPEQYGRTQTTPQADIYSLGALLSYLTSGNDPSEHPFNFPLLRHYGINGIRELNALIQRMVALDPMQRPADVQEVQAELQRIQQMNDPANKQPHLWTPPQSQTPPPANSRQSQIFLNASNTQPVRKTTRRNVLTVGLVASGIALFYGISALTGNRQYQINQSLGNLDQQPPDTQPPDTQTPDTQAPKYSYWSADLSLDATFGYVGQVYLYRNQRKDLFQTIQSPNSSVNLQWSPNNSQILVFTGKASGDVWEIQSGQSGQKIKIFSVTPATPTIAMTPMVAAWSPNGQYLATGISYQRSTTFTLFNTTNGKQLFQQTLSGQAVTSLAWMPDGRSILFPIPNDPNSPSSVWAFEIWDSQTQQKVSIIPNPTSSDLPTVKSISLLAISSRTNQVAFIYESSIWLGNLQKTQSIHKFADFGNVSPPADGGSPPALIWSPDEKYLAFLDSGNLSIWNVSNGQVVPLNNNLPQGYIEAFVWAVDSKSVIIVDNSATFTPVSAG